MKNQSHDRNLMLIVVANSLFDQVSCMLRWWHGFYSVYVYVIKIIKTLFVCYAMMIIHRACL